VTVSGSESRRRK